MSKLLNCMLKEWLLLLRDKLALVILFLMPIFFVIIIALFQFQPSNKQFPLLVYMHDNTQLNTKIYQALQHQSQLKIINAKQQYKHNLSLAKQAVAQGKYQMLLYFPKNISADLQAYTKNMLIDDDNASKNTATPKVMVYFDPAINGYVKNLLLQVLMHNIQQYQLKVASKFIAKLADSKVKKLQPVEKLLHVQYAESNIAKSKPNPVQQNVPAWTIFGMFFIVIPISTILIKERELGINQRIFIAPVSKLTLLLSRIVAFSLINLVQLLLMLLVGIFILPMLHLPALIIYQPELLLLTGLLTAFAATSFGLFIGSIVNTHEQASALGPLLIILAAAIGGIMLPTYLMPHSLQVFSSYSPLNWAQTAFVDLLVRQATLHTIASALLKLGLFGVMLLLLSYLISHLRTEK